MVKQQGALLAKGRLLGIQFDTLFTDDLYMKISKNAIETAARLKEILKEKGYVIARRTVAKYREQLGIPVARLRKEI